MVFVPTLSFFVYDNSLFTYSEDDYTCFTIVHFESNIHYQFAGGLLFVGLVRHPDARPGWSADRPVPGRTVDEANGRGRRGTESDHTTVHVSSSSRLDECQSASCHTGKQ